MTDASDADVQAALDALLDRYAPALARLGAGHQPTAEEWRDGCIAAMAAADRYRRERDALRLAVRGYLAHPSTDGHAMRPRMRAQLAELAGDGP